MKKQRILFALTTLVSIAFATAGQASSQAQSPLGNVIVQDTADKSASPFNLKSFIVVLDEAPLISLEDRLASRNREGTLSDQTAKLAARAAQAELIEAQQSAFASRLQRDLPDAKIDLRYDMVLNGLVVRSGTPSAREILSNMPGVKYVVRDSIVRACPVLSMWSEIRLSAHTWTHRCHSSKHPRPGLW